ncbi:MAG: hypothetical protein HFI09_04090 [Bacilli bacterium]|nr:hypothetical protein [Bacilli bacterium]
MGLFKKDNYIVKGVKLNNVYIKLQRLYIENGNKAIAYFGISDNRENLNKGLSLEELYLECEINKSKNIYEQLYQKSKEELFKDFEDDIVESEE